MDEAGRNKLWTEYNKTKSADIREKLILEYGSSGKNWLPEGLVCTLDLTWNTMIL